MVTQGRPVFVPYGAWELKATYQRNMVFGMLTMITMAVLAVSVPQVVSLLIGTRDSTVIVPPHQPRDSVLIIIRPIQAPSVVHERPVIPADPAQSVIMTGNVRAIAESLATDENNIVMPSQNELNEMNGPGAGDGVPDGSEIPGVMTDTGDAFPDADSFVAVEKLPEMLSYQEPTYPRIADQLGLTGIVWVRVLVDTEGKVRKAMVHRSSGIESLDNAALEAAFKNIFTPGIQNGHYVACWVSYRVEFKAGR